jgi:hypothetical protein
MYANRYQQTVVARLSEALRGDREALLRYATGRLRYRVGQLSGYLGACVEHGEAPRQGRLAFEAGRALQAIAEVAEAANLSLGTLLYWSLRDIDRLPEDTLRVSYFQGVPLRPRKTVPAGRPEDASDDGGLTAWLEAVAAHGEAAPRPDRAEVVAMRLLLQALTDPRVAGAGEVLAQVVARRRELAGLLQQGAIA